MAGSGPTSRPVAALVTEVVTECTGIDGYQRSHVVDHWPGDLRKRSRMGLGGQARARLWGCSNPTSTANKRNTRAH